LAGESQQATINRRPATIAPQCGSRPAVWKRSMDGENSNAARAGILLASPKATTERQPLNARRVEMWRGGFRLGISVAGPFGRRCLTSFAVAPFPHPAHRTGRADLPHPALGQNTSLPSLTESEAAGSPWGVTPQGSHRSVLAQLTHTAPHLMHTLPWRRLVVTLAQCPASMDRPCFPPKLHETLPPSLPRVP
jgi:hypothetical protein